ncbi:type VI secretion system baseplate subunit TssE [Limnohabitans sp. DM1]|uniref:type VI secretion system baseplate subunit TssE n=1 Tax=Limnohabitans sp. DM1 TaxID=1597955 RepID=UPI000B12ECD7|nr:type VI secretion system baseplate subunit TssE [Limnohabitans sp. DM1]
MTEHVTDVKETAMPGALHPAARALPSAHGLVQRQGEQVFMPTLLDRLCDDAPHESSEAPQAYTFNRGRMRETVLRDLSLLLNTTDQSDLIDAAQYPAAANSTLNYGVPALAGGYLSEKKWADIERMIRRAITQFEPRLVPQTLRVKPLLKDQASANYNVLTFEISGHIQISPYPIEFTVQSAVDLENSRIELRPR